MVAMSKQTAIITGGTPTRRWPDGSRSRAPRLFNRGDHVRSRARGKGHDRERGVHAHAGGEDAAVGHKQALEVVRLAAAVDHAGLGVVTQVARAQRVRAAEDYRAR